MTALEKYPVYLTAYQMGIIVGLMLKVQEFDKDWLPKQVTESIMKVMHEAAENMNFADANR